MDRMDGDAEVEESMLAKKRRKFDCVKYSTVFRGNKQLDVQLLYLNHYSLHAFYSLELNEHFTRTRDSECYRAGFQCHTVKATSYNSRL